MHMNETRKKELVELAKTRFVIDTNETGLYATDEDRRFYNTREKTANIVRHLIYLKYGPETTIVENLPMKNSIPAHKEKVYTY